MNYDGQPIACGDCGRPLAELLLLKTRRLTDPWGKPRVESVRCRCPYCNGHSHPVEVATTYHLSPAVHTPDSSEPGEYVELTAIGDSVRADGLSGDVVYRIIIAK